MMTINKEILLHPDFITGIADELCQTLEALIDSEFEKGDDADFDFIDECAEAINSIRSGDSAQILPFISRKDFLKKVGIKTYSRIKVFVVACAAIALIFTAATQIEVEENISLVQAFSGIVSQLFGAKQQITATEPTETTTLPEAEKTAAVTGITADTEHSFKTEYYIGEKFSVEGLRIFAEYSNGERILINSNDYSVEVSDSFGTKPGYETVKITSKGFTCTFEVRVLEAVATKKLNSVYAVFPDSFSFTSEDIYEIDLSSMQVFAIYSDGSENELDDKEYTVEYEYIEKLFEESVRITVTHKDCSCSFVIYEE